MCPAAFVIMLNIYFFLSVLKLICIYDLLSVGLKKVNH